MQTSFLYFGAAKLLLKRVYHVFQLMSIQKSAFFQTSATFLYLQKILLSYLRRAPYQDNRCTSCRRRWSRGRAPANATLQPPFAFWLNRTIPHSQIVKTSPHGTFSYRLRKVQTNMPSLLRSALLRVPPAALIAIKKKKATLSSWPGSFLP